MIPVGDTVASLVDAGTGLEFSETWYARFYRHNRQAGGEGGLGGLGGCQPTRGTQSLCGRASCAEAHETRDVHDYCCERRAPTGLRPALMQREHVNYCIDCAILYACSWHLSAHRRMLP